MSYLSKLMCGIILLSVPTIQYGGYFLLQLLAGKYSELGLNAFQRSMFRAGHAHAGVLVILALIAQILVDHARLPMAWEWVARIGFPLAAILISAGFFGGAAGKDVTEPTKLIWILYFGVLVLFAALVTLGIGLISSK
jgi:hypothetical protein